MNSELRAVAEQRLALEVLAIQSAGGALDEVTDQIFELLYSCSGTVFVTGSGTSGAVARRMAHLFSVSGTPSMFIQPSDALHGTMGALRSGDVLVAISKGGESDEINELATRARARGVTVVGLTSVPESSLGRLADLIQVFPIVPGADPGELIAMGSTLAHCAWGDSLAVALMQRRGYSWAEVAFTHPFGAVGKKTELPEE